MSKFSFSYVVRMIKIKLFIRNFFFTYEIYIIYAYELKLYTLFYYN
jgi:hypothetical protein